VGSDERARGAALGRQRHGGDLAYRYGRFDTLSDISFTPALAILAAAGFGTTAQTLQSLASLQDSSARLN
jgi:hypothetical protein